MHLPCSTWATTRIGVPSTAYAWKLPPLPRNLSTRFRSDEVITTRIHTRTLLLSGYVSLPDPEGLLFYDNLTDFGSLNTEKKVRYYCFYNNESVKAVRIDWYALDEDGNQNDEPLCSVRDSYNLSHRAFYLPFVVSHQTHGTNLSVSECALY